MVEALQSTPGRNILSFGAFELDLHAEELRRRGVQIHLQGVPLQVLAMLVQKPGELIERKTLFERLWPDDATGVLDDNLNNAIRKLRVALGDSARNPRFIETVPRRGYRFLAPVRPAGAPVQTNTAGVRSAEPSSSSDRPGLHELTRLFVGREREMAELGAVIDDCCSKGHDWLVMISGEAGIGKTRIVEQLADQAVQRGMRALWGKSLEEQAGPPYWPWVQVLQALMQGTDDQTLIDIMGEGAADLAGIVPGLGARLKVDPAQALTDAEQQRYRLFDSIAGCLRRAAERQPLMLVLDNLHCAGRPSLLLLQYLATTLTDAPIVLVGTYRGLKISRQHPLFDILGALNRQSRFMRLQLKGLSPSEVEQFLHIALGHRPPPSLAETVHRDTEGNPFFVREVVSMLVREGALGSAPEVQDATMQQPLAIEIPEGIREVIGKRLNQLSDACNAVLERAAVVGREFELDVLRHLVADRDDKGVDEAVAEAIAAGVIVEDGQCPQTRRFDHGLIRETLYDELGTAARARLHARVGLALEKCHAADPDSYLPRLAHHFARAGSTGDFAKAVDYGIRAAEQAESQLAYEDAVGFYQQVLECLEAQGSREDVLQPRLLLAMARNLCKAGRVSETLDLIERGVEAARRHGQTETLVGACLTIDHVVTTMGAGDERAVVLLNETLQVLDEPDSAQSAELLGALSRACYSVGQAQMGERAARESLELARRHGDERALVSAYRAKAYANLQPEHFDQRLSAADEMLRFAGQLGDRELERDAHETCFFCRFEAGDTTRAYQHLRWSAELNRAMRLPFHLHKDRVYEAMCAIMEGRYAEGEQLAFSAYQALQDRSRFRRDAAEGVLSMQMFAIRRDQGRLKELTGALRTFTRKQPVNSAWRPGLALIYAKLDMAEEAAREFQSLARDDFAAVPRDALWLTCLAYLTEVAVYLGDKAAARVLYEFLKPCDGRNLVAGACVAYLGAASHYLGLLAGSTGRHELACKHFEDALAKHRTMGARPWLARSQEAMAALLEEMADDQPPARVRILRDAAFEAARELGMAALEKRLAGAIGNLR